MYAQVGAPDVLYAPAGHEEQEAPPEGEKVPAEQGVQAVAPAAALNVPAAQGAHVELEEAPKAAENVPAGQGTGAEYMGQ